MDAEQSRRIEGMEARCRAENERATAARASFNTGRPPFTYRIICECALQGCEEMLDVPTGVYHEVRVDGRRFIVRPDHAIPGVERVVDRRRRFWVLEKLDAGPQDAEEQA